MTTTAATGVEHLFDHAHTAYDFAPVPVTDEELQSVYDTIKWAPTALNSQPLRIAFVRSDAGKADLERHVAEGNVPKVRSAPVTAILAYDADWHENLPALMPFAQDPHLAWQDRARREPMARFNASIQAGYFILGVRAHGLVAGPMGGFDKQGVDRTFFPDGRWHSLLLVNVGHPGEQAFRPRMPRLGFDEAAALL